MMMMMMMMILIKTMIIILLPDDDDDDDDDDDKEDDDDISMLFFLLLLGDGAVSEGEWVIWWCCTYGDTADFARYVWNQIAHGASSVSATDGFHVQPFSE